MKQARIMALAAALLLLAGTAIWSGCSREGDPLAPAVTAGGAGGGAGLDGPLGEGPSPELEAKSLTIVRNYGDKPPAELATIGNLTFWPYTGSSFAGEPIDPINLVFRGQADPLRIRAALLALDGDRTAFGLPDAWPFNARWEDCIGGNVQTAYAQGPLGWVGSVVQLSLGAYDPLRFHLRLFRTGVSDGAGGQWTLGGAHFEVRIPGTADHQVLSWEAAEQIVVADLVRSGLLDPGAPAVPSGPINAAPSFRTIPAIIYNGLPPELIALIGGPPPPVDYDVPLVSDGQGTVLNLAGRAPLVPGSWTQTASMEYGQLVPKPFCSTSPWDYLYVSGPITFHLTVTLSSRGEYCYHSDYAGTLTATPMDVTSGEPTPAGEPYSAVVNGASAGSHSPAWARVWSSDRKLTKPDAGPELLYEWLQVPDRGQKKYCGLTRCLDEDAAL